METRRQECSAGLEAESTNHVRRKEMGDQRRRGDKSMKSVYVRQLPADLQVLLDDMLGAGSGAKIHRRLWKHGFRIRQVPVSRFPRRVAFIDCRKERYARQMIGCNLPPIILCGYMLLDGTHRVWAARQEGRKTVSAIDLSEIGFTCNFQPACTLSSLR